MGRSLADLKAAAQSEKPAVDEIRPYEIYLADGEMVPLRDPDLITQAEEEDAPSSAGSGFKRQIYLMCPEADRAATFRRVWREMRDLDGYDLNYIAGHIGDHFSSQKSGKSRTPSRTSSDTPTPSRPTSASSSALT